MLQQVLMSWGLVLRSAGLEHVLGAAQWSSVILHMPLAQSTQAHTHMFPLICGLLQQSSAPNCTVLGC